MGMMFAIMGAALGVALACCGSGIGTGVAGQAAAGVVSEDPDKFGKALLLQALPGTQGIYGLVALFIILTKVTGDLTLANGLILGLAGLPTGISGLLSGIYQGKVAAAGCALLAKRPEDFGKGMVFAVVVETYAVLGLLSTILLVLQVK